MFSNIIGSQQYKNFLRHNQQLIIKNILRYYQKSIIKEEIEDMRLRRGMHWHEVTPNIKNPTGHFFDQLFLFFSTKGSITTAPGEEF